jgi:hypothetical protein
MFLLEIFNGVAGETKLQDEFLKQFEDYMNLNVLGKPLTEENWHLSTTQNLKKEKTIADQGMPKTRMFVDLWMTLLTSFYGMMKREKSSGKRAVEDWWKLMEMALQTGDFSDKDINAFGIQSNIFVNYGLT